MRPAGRHDRFLTRAHQLLSSLDDDLDLPRADTKALFGKRVYMYKGIAAAASSFAQNDLETGDLRVVDAGEDERFFVKIIALASAPTGSTSRHTH
jgi:hypothetical protein